MMQKKNLSWPWLGSLLYLFFMLILPILSLVATAGRTSLPNFWRIATHPIALSAYAVTLSMAFLASLLNGFFGFILAWVLVRYQFPGKKVLDMAVDLPFALPTSVAGLTIATVYGEQGSIGRVAAQCGVHILFGRLGILIAMMFVSFPFVVRSVQPVLREVDVELEEAAWCLGASPLETFRRVLFPSLLPSILVGVTLSFSRAIGEYGSIVIVSSNLPLKDLIAPVLIFQNLEQYEYESATVIGTVVLLLSLLLLAGVNLFQSWNRKLRG